MTPSVKSVGAVRLNDAAVSAQGNRLPLGKTDWVQWDRDLQCFGLRWRNGAQTWIVQYRTRGKSQRRTIGGATGPFALGAKQAREKAEIRLAEIKLGVDQASTRGGIKFGSIVKQYLDGLENGTIGIGRDRSRKIRPRSLSAIKIHFRLHWSELNGSQLIEVDRKAIAKRLSEITENSGPTASNRARASLSGFFRWAIGEGLASANPVIGTNQAPENNARERVLEDDEIIDVWNACRDDQYGRIVKLLILTGQRKGEVAGMAGSELDTALWMIPGERTKNRAAHRVPLSDAAIAIIESQDRVVDRDLLFGDGAGPFSGWSRCKRRLDERIAGVRKAAGRKPMKPWILHDLRRTVRTRLGKLGITPHVSEAVLNHLPATLVQTYDRHDYTEEKREALETWASHVETITSPIRAKGVSVRAIALVEAEAPRATFAERLALVAK